MYSISDYLFNGLLYLNNTLRPRHKRLSQLMLYANTMCQSRCKHCNIWQKPHEYLTFDEVKAIVGSRCVTRRTVVGLEGGEFLLHPQAKEIMAWLQHNHPKYTLLSNGLAPALVIDAVRQYHPVRLYLSLDGPRETYKVMRGRDGYDHVIECIETLKDEVPISLMFCLSPWNSMKDMEHVINVARKYGIDVRIGIYGTMDFFDTTAEMIDTTDYLQNIPQNIHQTQENYDFVALYDEWRRGHLRRGVVAVQNVRQLAAADIAGRMDIPPVDVFAEPRPPCRMEPGTCLGPADRGRGAREHLKKKTPLRVQRNRSRMAGLLVGMALRRSGPPL